MPKNVSTPIFAILALITFVGVIWYSISDVQKKAPTEPNSDNVMTRVPPAGWKEYRNVTYGFSFFYPTGLTVKEFKESGSALTVTFEDIADEKEFQMFIVPYATAEITPERFKLDIPSGVKEKEEDLMIDGARGKKFFSQDRLLGDTREMWFVRGGFLYEVTTHKALDTWMQNILATWRFFQNEKLKP